jgi:hypothetical protein
MAGPQMTLTTPSKQGVWVSTLSIILSRRLHALLLLLLLLNSSLAQETALHLLTYTYRVWKTVRRSVSVPFHTGAGDG